MKMGRLKFLEFWVRIVAWLCAVVFLTSTIREIIDNSNSFIRYSYWVFPAATLITGFFDMLHFHNRN